MQNAPLNAMRSQLVPVHPEEYGPALVEMSEGPAPRAFLPVKMATQWNVRRSDGSYRRWDASPRSFVAVQAPPVLRPSGTPFRPMAELAQAMQDEMWTQIHSVEPHPPPALARKVPYPGRLPVRDFAELDQWGSWASTRRQTARRDRRIDAVREIAASDEMIASILQGRR